MQIGKMDRERTKAFEVSQEVVYESYLNVCVKDGGAGIDKETIEEFNKNLGGNLYKIWNRIWELSTTTCSHGIDSEETGGLSPVGHSNGRRPYCTRRGEDVS